MNLYSPRTIRQLKEKYGFRFAKGLGQNFLTDPVRYSEIRNMYGYTGTYKGVPVSVQGSGMGIASMGIYSWELFSDHGVESIIRVGTAGSFSPAIHVGDVVLGLAASTDSSYVKMFGVNGTYSPSCSYDLLCEVQAASREAGIRVTAGNILSSDHFYEVDPDWWKPWSKEAGSGRRTWSLRSDRESEFLPRRRHRLQAE